MHRKQRINGALALLALGLALNVVLLIKGVESPGWLVAAVVLLFAAALSLLAERRAP